MQIALSVLLAEVMSQRILQLELQSQNQEDYQPNRLCELRGHYAVLQETVSLGLLILLLSMPCRAMPMFKLSLQFRVARTFLCLALLFVASPAKPEDIFTPPQALPKSKYEYGWSRNPFALKAAPAAVVSQSFAKDLFLLNASQMLDEVTVVIANVKTMERFRLTTGETAMNGMRIHNVVVGDSTKDSFVEVELNGERAVLRHSESGRKVLSAKAAKPIPKPESKDLQSQKLKPDGIESPTDVASVLPPAPMSAPPLPAAAKNSDAMTSTQEIGEQRASASKPPTAQSRRRLTAPTRATSISTESSP